jgi:hypothetical protein
VQQVCSVQRCGALAEALLQKAGFTDAMQAALLTCYTLLDAARCGVGAGAYNRVDTKATTEGTLQLPVSLLLLRTSPAFGGPFGCRPLVPVTQFTPEQMKHKGVVLQIMPDCINMDLLLDVNIWDSILVRV